MCAQISALVDGGPSEGSSMRRPGSKDHHWCGRKFWSEQSLCTNLSSPLFLLFFFLSSSTSPAVTPTPQQIEMMVKHEEVQKTNTKETSIGNFKCTKCEKLSKFINGVLTH